MNTQDLKPEECWWCPICNKYVPPLEVTHRERHDERCGGCGSVVLSVKPDNSTAADAAKEETEQFNCPMCGVRNRDDCSCSHFDIDSDFEAK